AKPLWSARSECNEATALPTANLKSQRLGNNPGKPLLRDLRFLLFKTRWIGTEAREGSEGIHTRASFIRGRSQGSFAPAG
ncbi:MAG: hypothetical protein JJU29_11420, partial [Verrucomicrobia bacterium]|nr:hypothetical protein [Verrucomicrobiota bacterium]